MLSFKLAVRFLKSGRIQTVLIVIGIAIAISVQVLVGLLIGSLQQTIVDRTIGNAPKITIESATDEITIEGWQPMVAEIEQVDSVTAVAVSAGANAFVEKGARSLPVFVRGFELEAADRIYSFSTSVYEGRMPESPEEALIGKELSEMLEASIGESLSIITPYGASSRLSVSGFYDLGLSTINESWVVTHMETAQQMFGFGNGATSIGVDIDDVFKADTVALEIEESLSDSDLTVSNWKDENEELLSGLEGQRISSIMIQAAVVASVVIAISSILAISVLQKSRQIGILKAMGIKDRAASLIFLIQGFLLGLMGSVIGIGLGLGLLYAFNAYATAPDGSPLIDLYVRYDFILLSWFIALLASTLAAVIPARRSSRLNPIDVIREG